tara:strand:+ start:6143 stop:8098 length:1956 start_codon:yes stop_codon:yes gene_type:complete
MSLIITSSSQGVNETNQIGIAQPQQYKNYLQNSLMIPPNSEIAVESIKINRLPLLDLGAGVTTNFWFGERLSSLDSYKDSISYMIPTQNTIGKSISPLDFTEEYAKILKSAYSFHPEIDSVNIAINISTTSSGAFSGFDFEIPQVAADATSLVSASTTTLVQILGPNPVTSPPTWDGTNLNGSAGQFAQLQPRATEGGPISLYNGLLTYGTSTLNTFTVGLARPYCRDNMTTDIMTPREVFRSINNKGLGIIDSDYYDYAAQVGADGKLRLYHSIPAPKLDTQFENADNSSRLIMSEIRYYEKNSTSFTANNGPNSSFATGSPITWSSASDAISFEVSGEGVSVKLGASLVVAPNTVNASTKGQVPKPVGQTAWKMYPTVGFWNDGDDISITAYNCRTSSTIWNNQPENTWNTRLRTAVNLPKDGQSLTSPEYALLTSSTDEPWNNATEWGRSVDLRSVYRPYEALDASPDVPTSGSAVRTYRGISASVIGDYENIFIMGNSERYMSKVIQQWQPNSQFALGFQSFAINPTSGMVTSGSDRGAYFSSAQRPSLSSLHSAFIRVPTFTHETYNFGTGNMSKILFQIPRFDNSGLDTGALYYQNNDKTYVDLRNISELRITDLDIHVVRKNETFVEDLTGSTEIVFHIRKIKS